MSADDYYRDVRDGDDTRTFQGANEWSSPRSGRPPYTFEAHGPPASASATSDSLPGAAHNSTADGIRGATSRRAHLRVSRVSPWSVTKFSFVVSLVCFIALFVAVAILYAVLAAMGVFAALNSLITSIAASPVDLFAASRILGYAAFIGGINVVLMTLLATLGAFVYNVAADLVGGVEVTLTEKD